MAKKKKSRSEQSLVEAQDYQELKESLGDDFGSAYDALQQVRETWKDKESLLMLKNNEAQSVNYRSRVNDGRLATIVWERTARVMSKIPTGQVRALTKKDEGKSALMDLALWRYIIPNANAQMNHLTKLRLWNFYASVYGSMPMLRFWNVSDTYVGPDCYLVPIRNFFPQPGKISMEESDWCMISSTVTVGDLKNYLKDGTDTWDKKAVEKVIKSAKDGGKQGKKSATRDTESLVDEDRNQNVSSGKGDFAEVELMTKYESGKDGHWITFCPDHENEIIRDVENQHKDGKIPVIMKHCFPLIDSILGLGDFERGQSLQFAMNSLTNIFLDTMKMQLYKPLVVNPSEVYPSSIKQQPGAIWKEKSTNAIREMQFSPTGMNTFMPTYQFLSQALQSQNGTTSAEVSSGDSGEPTYGKTPQGIEQAQARESARDNWDRFMMENAVGELYESFVNMLCNNKTEDQQSIFHVFDKEVNKISQIADHEDIKDVFTKYDSGKAGEVKISGKRLKGVEYRFLIDAGSTKTEDQRQAFERVSSMLNILPNLEPMLEREEATFKAGELIKQMLINSGIDGWEKIIVQKQEAGPGGEQGVAGDGTQPPEGAQPPGNKEVDFSNIAYKDAPEDIKRAWEQRELGMASQQMSPAEQKNQLDAQKLELARQKLEFQKEVAMGKQAIAEGKANLEQQRHIGSQDSGGPGYAEPVPNIVQEMDRLAGFVPGAHALHDTPEDLQDEPQLGGLNQGGQRG